MANSPNKTKENGADVTTFIEAVVNEQQRADAYKIVETMSRLSGQLPKMWGPSIIGFGQYHYTYESGREGDMCRIGFSPRKENIVLYVTDVFEEYAGLMAKLGKHKTGKSCLYIKRLSDINEGILQELCGRSLDHMRERYPEYILHRSLAVIAGF